MPLKSDTSPSLPHLAALPALQLLPQDTNSITDQSSPRPSSAGAEANSPGTAPFGSFSLSSRTRSKSTSKSGLLDAPSSASSSGSGSLSQEQARRPSPLYSSQARERGERDDPSSSSLRRSHSDKLLSSFGDQVNPISRTGTTAADALLQNARLKMYSQDSEAMQRARTSLMEVSGGTPSASGMTSTGSPTSPSSFFHLDAGANSSSSPSQLMPSLGSDQLLQQRQVPQRRSTLSNEIKPDARYGDEPGSSTGEGFAKPFDPERDKLRDMDTMRGMSRTRSGSLTLLKEAAQNQHRSRPDYVIAVVGAPGSGKSTVIRKAFKAWGMTEPVQLTDKTGRQKVLSSSAQVDTGKSVNARRTVDILEIDIGLLNLSDAAEVPIILPGGTAKVWPSFLPKISGALVCYDAYKSESLEGVKEFLSLVGLQFPVVMLGCKSDPGVPRAVEPRYANSLGEPFGVGLIEVTTHTTEGKTKMKMGFSWLLRTIARDRHRREKSARKAALVDQSLHIQTSALPPDPDRGPNSAADSDTSTGSHAQATDKVLWRGSGDQNDLSSVSDPLRRAYEKLAKDQRADEEEDVEGNVARIESSACGQDARNEPREDVNDKAAEAYQTLESLYSKLFFAIASGSDNTFVKQFFLTYRRFCAPADVLFEFLRRIKEVSEGTGLARDVKLWTLMKLCGALIDWTMIYPGDFESSVAQEPFKEIFHTVVELPHLAHLAGELAIFVGKLDTVVDLDKTWAFIDSDTPRDSAIDGDLPEDLAMSIHGEYLHYTNSPSTSSVLTKGSGHTYRKSLSTSSLPQPLQSASTVEFPPDLTGMRGGSGSDLSKHEDSSDGSRSVRGTVDSSDSGNRGQDHSGGKWSAALLWLSRSDERHVASELTRYQWELFSSIRPRDIFRHDFGKEQNDSVAKSIQHFNHLSRWVSTLILAHSKPKHRARVYEQFMLIAQHLRKLNNYDSLYAVISGMREASVHRLGQTHALVKATDALQKDFQSHLKLMDPRGGYITYRKALQSDAAHGRSAIPLLTNILGLVSRLQVIRPEERRKSDDMVQWDKFAQFADILFVISDCQSRGSPVPMTSAGSVIGYWLEETPVIDSEDDLFERSRLLEAGPNGPGGASTVLRQLRTFGFHD